MTKIYKFVKWEVPSIEALKDAKAVRLRTHIDNGGRLTRQDKNWITEEVMLTITPISREPYRFRAGVYLLQTYFAALS